MGTRVSSTRTAHTWRLFSIFAKRLKKPVFCAKAGPRIQPGTWVSPQSVRKCWFERSCRDICEKYRGRAHRSPRTSFVHHHVFSQGHLISPNIDFHLKLMPSPNNFVCKSAAPGQAAQQENYKLVIQSVNLIIYTKKLTSMANGVLMNLFVHQNMRHHLLRVQMKHLSISSNQTSINFDNVFTGALPDLVIFSLVSDADLAGGYQRNPFNFQNFGVNRIELKRNGTSRPRLGYTPNFANGQYIKAYMMFHQKLECDTGDKSVSITLSEWDNEYTLYAFNITDGLIGPGTYGQ